MSLFKIFSLRLFAMCRQDEIEREVNEELRFHIEMSTHEMLASGMTLENARETAVRRFGDVERVRKMCCEVQRSSINRETVEPFAWMLTGFALAFWTMSREYHNLPSMLMLLAAIAIMTRSLFIAYRLSRTKAFTHALAGRGESVKPFRILETKELQNVSAHDARGRTPIERVLDDE
ncbi:MAG: permease prefix domain 1-containing protein [Acidobacteriota bacterium]|nr:permease prefix domain 1-containing protein [Acidobacteriota bacterium]